MGASAPFVELNKYNKCKDVLSIEVLLQMLAFMEDPPFSKFRIWTYKLQDGSFGQVSLLSKSFEISQKHLTINISLDN